MPQPPTVPEPTGGPRPWYHVGPVSNVAAEGEDGQTSETKTADVYLYDIIGGWWGMTADDFVRDVVSLDVDHIELHLNSPGGEVSEGVAIANVLRQHQARVRVWVDGMAASSGSVVAMAGDEIVMGVGGQMMVHNPKTWAVGDADEMTKVANMLESVAESIASTYAARAGGTAADWRQVMKAETWYTAAEAVDAGLADRVATDDDKGTATGQKVTPGGSSGIWDLWDTYKAQDRFDLSPFNYQGRGRAPAPKLPERVSPPSTASAQAALAAAADAAGRIRAAAVKKAPVAGPANGPATTTEGAAEMQFTDEERTELRTRFSLAADADDDAIKAVLMSPPAPTGGGTDADPSASAAKPVTVAPPGMRLVADSAWQQKEERIKKLEAHVAKQVRDERDQVIASAVKDGKFTVAQKDHFSKLWDSDPEGTRALIDSLQKDKALATAELGYAGGDDEAEAELAEFDNLLPPFMRTSVKAGR